MNGLAFKTWLQEYTQPITSPPLVMGILNLTVDSFSDGAKYLNFSHAKQRVNEMLEQGVDLIDIGAESSRPGAITVDEKNEVERLLPLIEWIRSFTDICISVDTNKPYVMDRCLAAGADMINDIFALRAPEALDIIAHYEAPVCLMHVQGDIKNFGHDIDPSINICQSVIDFFHQRLNAVTQAGVKVCNIMIDPGFGFGKDTQQNLQLLRYLHHLNIFARPILLGLSRKRFIGDVLAQDVMNRQVGSLAANQFGFTQGARIFRTHDVKETKQMINMSKAIMALEYN